MSSLSAAISSPSFTTSNLRLGRAQAGSNGAQQLLIVLGRQQQQREDAMTAKHTPCSSKPNSCCSKRNFLLRLLGTAPLLVADSPAFAERPQFRELEGSRGLKALDIREGSGRVPQPGDKVAIHYYARLAAKQGWRFDSTYDHKDSTGTPEPYVFVIGSGTVRSLKGWTWLYKQ
eukprot:c19216_g1_i1 orf=55-576(+)